jgi:ArsR family transcriptional regulator, nickel/cobalt-responsive transcriptional repressor
MEDALESDRCARLLRAMGDRERLKIVQCLREGPKNVGEIANQLGVEVVNVSHHLGVLRQAGLVLDQRQGRFIVYRLHPDVFHPSSKGQKEHLDFGCCRLEIPKEAGE